MKKDRLVSINVVLIFLTVHIRLWSIDHCNAQCIIDRNRSLATIRMWNYLLAKVFCATYGIEMRFKPQYYFIFPPYLNLFSQIQTMHC